MLQVPFYLVLIVAALAIGLLLYFGFLWTQLKSRVEYLEAQLNTNQSLTQGLQKEVEQFQLTSIQLNKQDQEAEQAIIALKEYLDMELGKLTQQLSLISADEPVDKLYSRALKLVAKGADLDELISECELPRAEAEMLLAIHRNAK